MLSKIDFRERIHDKVEERQTEGGAEGGVSYNERAERKVKIFDWSRAEGDQIFERRAREPIKYSSESQ